MLVKRQVCLVITVCLCAAVLDARPAQQEGNKRKGRGGYLVPFIGTVASLFQDKIGGIFGGFSDITNQNANTVNNGNRPRPPVAVAVPPQPIPIQRPPPQIFTVPQESTYIVEAPQQFISSIDVQPPYYGFSDGPYVDYGDGPYVGYGDGPYVGYGDGPYFGYGDGPPPQYFGAGGGQQYLGYGEGPSFVPTTSNVVGVGGSPVAYVSNRPNLGTPVDINNFPGSPFFSDSFPVWRDELGEEAEEAAEAVGSYLREIVDSGEMHETLELLGDVPNTNAREQLKFLAEGVVSNNEAPEELQDAISSLLMALEDPESEVSLHLSDIPAIQLD